MNFALLQATISVCLETNVIAVSRLAESGRDVVEIARLGIAKPPLIIILFLLVIGFL